MKLVICCRRKNFPPLRVVNGFMMKRQTNGIGLRMDEVCHISSKNLKYHSWKTILFCCIHFHLVKLSAILEKC